MDGITNSLQKHWNSCIEGLNKRYCSFPRRKLGFSLNQGIVVHTPLGSWNRLPTLGIHQMRKAKVLLRQDSFFVITALIFQIKINLESFSYWDNIVKEEISMVKFHINASNSKSSVFFSIHIQHNIHTFESCKIHGSVFL